MPDEILEEQETVEAAEEEFVGGEETPESEPLPTVAAVEQTAYENIAQTWGWVPKEKYRGDKSEWVDAKTFVLRDKAMHKSTRAHARTLEREMESLKRSVEQLSAHQRDANTMTIQQQILRKKENLKDAVEEGDTEKTLQISRAIYDLEAKAVPVNEQNQGIPPEIQHWIDDNPWYEDDDELKAKADKVFARSKRRGLLFDEAAEEVADAIEEIRESRSKKEGEPKKKNGNPTNRGVNDVSSGRNQPHGGVNRHGKTYATATRFEQDVCDSMLKQGVFAVDEKTGKPLSMEKRRQIYFEQIPPE